MKFLNYLLGSGLLLLSAVTGQVVFGMVENDQYCVILHNESPEAISGVISSRDASGNEEYGRPFVVEKGQGTMTAKFVPKTDNVVERALRSGKLTVTDAAGKEFAYPLNLNFGQDRCPNIVFDGTQLQLESAEHFAQKSQMN